VILIGSGMVDFAQSGIHKSGWIIYNKSFSESLGEINAVIKQARTLKDEAKMQKVEQFYSCLFIHFIFIIQIVIY
jgi:hypothetical protein